MPSLTGRADRHSIVDRREGHYLSFPDICRTAEGRVLVVYREADKHVWSRGRLLLRASDDKGRTWGPRRMLDATGAHCPRIVRLTRPDDGQLAMLCDGHGAHLFLSADHGDSWASSPCPGIRFSMPDRILELDAETWLTTAHGNRGVAAQPFAGQPVIEQMVLISQNRGASWKALGPLNTESSLLLCEASMARMPDGRVLCLLRENSHVGEPMYLTESRDQGQTWSEPRPTPLVGHRPTLGLTRSGRLLATFRNRGPDGGTAAFLGDEADFLADYAVQSLAPDADCLTLTVEGLLARCAGGPDSCLRWMLRPLTRPAHARAVLELDIQVHEGSRRDACGCYFGGWWRFFPNGFQADFAGEGRRSWVPGRPHRLRFVLEKGEVALFVDNRHRLTRPLPEPEVRARPVLLGNLSLKDENAGSFLLRSASLAIDEPRLGRVYRWAWESTHGLPDAWARRRVLELANDRRAEWPDYGYSGWTELDDDEFLCVYHHGGGDDPGYQGGLSSHVQTTRFFAGDWD